MPAGDRDLVRNAARVEARESLAEMAIAGRIGLDVDLPQSELSDHAALFGETNGRIIVAVQPDDAQRFLAAMGDAPVHLLGITVLEPGLHLEIDGEPAISLAVEALLDAWQPNAATGAQP